MSNQSTTFERHYRIADLCDLWGIGRETLRKILVDEPGVVKIRMGRRKCHTTYSVPESVAERIHSRLASGSDSGPGHTYLSSQTKTYQLTS